MAHGYLTPTDIRGQGTLLGDIAGAIGSRIKKSSDMARKERAFASKKAEEGGTSLEERGIGRGYFFKRALGSSFGGDRIARTRGRFETDPGPGRDPTGTQASRFRGGFDYGVTNKVSPPTGGTLASIVSASSGGAGGGVAGFLGSGAQAINPEVLGGELAKYQATKRNAAGFSTVDTTASEVKDLAGILNQIGELIVRTNNNTITAIDGVQRVNVRVVESVQSLGKLQAALVGEQMQQQLQIASAAEAHQEQMLQRQLAAAEASRFTQDDKSGGLAVNSFGGRLPGQGGPGGRGGAGGGRGLAGFGAKAGAYKLGKAVMKRGGARAAGRLGAAVGMKVGGKAAAKMGAKVGAKTLAGVVGKKLPFGLGLAVAGGFAADRFGKGDVVGGIGEILSGLAATIPGVGTAASLGIDGLLAARDFGMTPFASGGIVNRPTAGLVGEAGAEGIFPLEGKKGRDTFLKFGEGIMEAQRKNETAYVKRETTVLENYFDRKGGWDRFGEILAELLKNLNPFRRDDNKNGGGGTGGNFSGNSNEDKAMNYLMGQGLTQAQGAGIAGNLAQESSFNPMADNTGTGESDSAGHFGIAQWDKVNRWPKVKKWMLDNGLDPYSLEGQLQALQWEAKERGDWQKITKTSSAEESAASWLENFERSGEKPGEAGYDNRIAHARRLSTKQLSGIQSGNGMATFGETGNVSNAENYVHGHFQTTSGTKQDLVNDVTPIVRGLLNSGVTDVTVSNGGKFRKDMSDAEIRSLIESGISQHTHSGDGRSVDIFVPKGTPVPFPLSDVKNTGGAGGVTGILPGSGKTFVGHLTTDSKSGSRQPMVPRNEPNNTPVATAPTAAQPNLLSLLTNGTQTPDVLARSAQVSAQGNALTMNPIFVMGQNQKQQTPPPLIPTSMAGPSSGMVTPSWLINSNLR